jgi:hypothetical protein
VRLNIEAAFGLVFVCHWPGGVARRTVEILENWRNRRAAKTLGLDSTFHN